jgi:hypothetical protein
VDSDPQEGVSGVLTQAMVVPAPTKCSERFGKSLAVFYLYGCEENLVYVTEKGGSWECSRNCKFNWIQTPKRQFFEFGLNLWFSKHLLSMDNDLQHEWSGLGDCS